jgi:hypothetical protein
MSPEEQIIDDSEMPVAPAEEVKQVEVSGEIDASLFDAVPVQGDAMPVGTYHFRLDRYTTGESEPSVKKPERERYGKQPYFMLLWICQQEPHTGRIIPPEYCGWCTPEVFKAAKEGDSTARAMVAERLMVAKDVMAAAGMKAVGAFNFVEFLGTNPECKLQLGLADANTDSGKVGADGKKVYVKTGMKSNKVLKHISLTRPA